MKTPFGLVIEFPIGSKIILTENDLFNDFTNISSRYNTFTVFSLTCM